MMAHEVGMVQGSTSGMMDTRWSMVMGSSYQVGQVWIHWVSTSDKMRFCGLKKFQLFWIDLSLGLALSPDAPQGKKP